MKSTARRLPFLALCAALALLLSYAESLLPPLYPAVPGIKMGLANTVGLFLLCRYSLKEAAAVTLVRLLGAMLLLGTPMTFLYSLAGAALSLLAMAGAKRLHRFTPVGLSMVGGVAHNIGQVLVAMAVLRTPQIGYYLLVLTLTGTAAGVCIGIGTAAVLKAFEKSRLLP